MTLTNNVYPIAAQSINATDILATNTWYPLNPVGLEAPCFYLKIVNGSNTSLGISYDGVTAHDYVEIGDSLQLNFQVNNQLPGNIANEGKYGVIYVATAVLPLVPTGIIVLTGFTSYI